MDGKSWNQRHQQRLSFGHVVATGTTSTSAASVMNHWQRINSDNLTNENIPYQNHIPLQQNQLQQLKYFHVQKQPNTQYTMQVPGSLQQQQLQCCLPQHYSFVRQDTIHTDRMHNRVDKQGIIPYLQMNNPCINPNMSLLSDSFTILNADISIQQQLPSDQYGDINFRQYQVDHQQKVLRANNDLPIPLTEVSLTTYFALKTSYEGQVYVASVVDPTIVPYDVISPFSFSCKGQVYVNAIEAVPDMLKDIRPILPDIGNFLTPPIFTSKNQQTYDSTKNEHVSNLSRTNKQKLRNLNWTRFLRKNCQLVVSEFYQRPSRNSITPDVINYQNHKVEACRSTLPDCQHNLLDTQKSYADVLQENDCKQDISYTTCKATEKQKEICFHNCTIADNISDCTEKCNSELGKEGVSECPSKRLYKMAEAFCLEQLENLAFFRAFEPYDRSKKRLPYTEMFVYQSQNKMKSTNSGDVAITTSIKVGSKQMYVSAAENRGSLKLFQKLRKKYSTIGSLRDVSAWRTNYHDFLRRNY